MGMKRWLTAALVVLAFAGAGAAIHGAWQDPAASGQPATLAAGVGDAVVVTYFSSDYRCASCVRIEALTRRSIESNFADDLANGRVVFQVVNLDQPGNAHFIEDYRLISKTVIVSQFVAGRERRWLNLQQVWTEQRDAEAFDRYVSDAVRGYLGQPG